MDELLSHLVDAPLANIFILAGLAFLAIGILGKISNKIEPSTTGRILSAVVGVALMIYGVHSHGVADGQKANRATTATSVSAQPPQRKPGPVVEGRLSEGEKGNRAATTTAVPGQPSQKNPGLVSESRLFGMWKNANPQTRGVTRLEVQQNGGLVAVRAWAACSPHDCEWGTNSGSMSGESASITWDQGTVLRTMALSPDGHRLRMVLDSVYRDNRAPQHGLEYFVKE
jgi:hypothetical protein